MPNGKRSVNSIKNELVTKSKEAALSAIKIFNDPLITFKSETFIILMVVAWTYLLHAYYRSKKIEYRYYKQGPKRRLFDRTNRGSYKYWELERCLKDHKCPIDRNTTNNLKFLIGLRHEIEHQMTRSLDSYLSGRYQACAINYNDYLKNFFGKNNGIDTQLTYSIQFIEISEEQIRYKAHESLIPKKLQTYIANFDGALNHEEYNSPRFSYRLLFKKKVVNRPGQADRVIEFIDPESEAAKQIDKEYWVKKEVERPKFRPTDVVQAVKKAGFPKFRTHPEHVLMWKSEDAKNPAKGYGVNVQGVWYWYQNWIDRCIELCEANSSLYKDINTPKEESEQDTVKIVPVTIADQRFLCKRLSDEDFSSFNTIYVILCVGQNGEWTVIDAGTKIQDASTIGADDKKGKWFDRCPHKNIWVCSYSGKQNKISSQQLKKLESSVYQKYNLPVVLD